MSGRWRNAELAWQPLYGVQIEETTGWCRSLNPARHGLTVSGTGCFENPDYQKQLSNSALDFSAEDDGPKARAEPSQTQLAPSALSLALIILGRAEQVGSTDHKRVW